MIGEMVERVSVFKLDQTGTAFQWQEVGRVWASVEPMDKANLFSKIGIGAKSAKFKMRKRELSPHDALGWGEDHYFITDVKVLDRAFCEVTTAQVQPISCSATRPEKVKDEKGKISYIQQPLCSFPGILIEKYMGFVQKEPQAQTEITFVLVAPKPIVLKVSDLITVGSKVYAVTVAHDLDRFKNEYEIHYKADV